MQVKILWQFDEFMEFKALSDREIRSQFDVDYIYVHGGH